MWSRATSTMKGNKDRINFALHMMDQIILNGPYEHFGPLSLYNHCGYEVAIQMVLQSRYSGNCSTDDARHNTIRQLKLSSSNQVRAAQQSNQRAITNYQGNY